MWIPVFEIRPGEYSSMPSTSRNTVNANLFYEKQGLNVRLGAHYVSRNLWAIGSSSATDVFSEPRLSMDFGSSYPINENMAFYLNAKNITNTPLKFAEGTPDRAIQREFYGPTYQAGSTINY